MSGPQRKPTATLLLSGSDKGKTRAKTEPRVGYAIPDPPPNISKGAMEYWPYVCETVGHLRCVTESDALQMGILAQSLYEYNQACADIEVRGPVLISEKTGAEYPSPAVNRQSSIYTRLQNCLDRFGLNPSNRSKVVELAPKLGVVEEMKPKKSRYAE